MGTVQVPAWMLSAEAPATEEFNDELYVPLPQFFTLCGLVPFLVVSVLHLVYASACWDAYARTWVCLGMILLNVLVLVPYVNVVAFPALMAWLFVAGVRCHRSVDTKIAAPAPAPAPAPISSSGLSLSLSGGDGISTSHEISLSSSPPLSNLSQSMGISLDVSVDSSRGP